MLTQDINLYLQTQSQLIERELNKLVSEKDVPYNQLFKAARYSLLSGGKRLRPTLALATCELLGGDLETALTPVCALEMIHTYSMIHDDLPCMDNDDFRRGIPTLHKAFPEAHALLAGDYLLTRAFEVLAEAPGLSSDQKVQLISILARGSGGDGMIAGQVLDIEAEKSPMELSLLTLTHCCKTGALISAAVEFGAFLGHSTDEQMSHLRSFANEIGLAFQIVDDILDVTSSHLKHGKTIASDVANSKTTYVSLLGLEKSKAAAERHSQKALAHLQRLNCDTTRLAEIAKLIVARV